MLHQRSALCVFSKSALGHSVLKCDKCTVINTHTNTITDDDSAPPSVNLCKRTPPTMAGSNTSHRRTARGHPPCFPSVRCRAIGNAHVNSCRCYCRCQYYCYSALDRIKGNVWFNCFTRNMRLIEYSSEGFPVCPSSTC